MIYGITEIRVGSSNIVSGFVGSNLVFPVQSSSMPIIAIITTVGGEYIQVRNAEGYPYPNELNSDSLSGYTGSSIATTTACTSIGNAALSGTNFEHVILSSGLEYIWDSAFADCSGLTSIDIPNSVTGISYNAFDGCSSLESVTLPSGITIINDYTFDGCSSLSSITIPNSVSDIGVSAFNGCSSLSSITIPNSIYQIGDSAFADCSGLTSVTIPINVSRIDDNAFDGCSSLEWIEFEGYVPPSGGSNVFANTNNCPIYVPCQAMDDYKALWPTYAERITCIEPIYDGKVKLILNNQSTVLFPYWGTITTEETSNYKPMIIAAEVGSKCTGIGNYAFENCSGLTSITIPNSSTEYSVTRIGSYAFNGCYALPSVTIPDCVTSIEVGAFYGCSGLTSVTIGSGVTSIGNYVFCNCRGLTSIEIPDGVTSIGKYTFESCFGLTSVSIGSGVTSIGQSAFYGCRSLSSITIPDSVTSVGNGAFQYCDGLASVTIGSGVTSLGPWMLGYCSGLTSITVEATTPPTIGTNTLNTSVNCPIYVPAASVETYKTAWSDYASRIQAIQ